MVGEDPSPAVGRRRQIEALDEAVYRAIAATPTPQLDRDLGRLSRFADHSKIWIATAGVLALTGSKGRRAAVDGLASVAVSSAIVNLVAKPLGGRRRPDRGANEVPVARHVTMPRSTSFPSGHAGSSFAFSTGVAASMPEVAVPIEAVAALVTYSRVHTGVHFPADVIVGALIGTSVARLTTAGLKRFRAGGG